MNAYYWQVYQQEVLRLIHDTDITCLKQYEISPWKYPNLENSKAVFENDLKHVDTFKATLAEVYLADYAGYAAYCERLGETPAPAAIAGNYKDQKE
jgi:hypothetical protein